MVRIVSLSVLLTLIVVLGLTFFKVLAPFLLPLFLAAVFAILCQPVQSYFLERTSHHVRWASGLTTAAVVSLILIPLVVGTILASLQLFVVATNLSDRNLGRALRTQTEPVLQAAADFLNARMRKPSHSRAPDQQTDSPPTANALPSDNEPATSDEALSSTSSATVEEPTTSELPPAAESEPAATSANAPSVPQPSAAIVNAETAEDSTAASRGPPQPVTAEGLRQQLQRWVRTGLSEMGRKSLGMAGGTLDLLSGSLMAIGSAALSFVIFAIALYYFLADGTQLVRSTERLIPVHVAYQRQMLNQFSRVVRAVVMATFFAALTQSIATVAALWLFGFDHLFIIFILSLLVSMIPMMGTWLVWLPCAGYLLYNGHWFQALLLSVYGAAFVGLLDNVVRTYVLNTDVKLHPLLALISVLGGLQVMGLWGMFVGPIVASCLHALVQIFNHELAALSKEKFAGGTAPETSAGSGGSPAVLPTPPLPSVAKADPTGENESASTDGDTPSNDTD